MTATKSPASDALTADVYRGSEFVVIGDPTVIHAQNFSSLLTQDVLLDLGEVDVSWFTRSSPPSIQFSSVFSDDGIALNVDEVDCTQDSRCNPLPVAMSPILSQSTHFEEGCYRIEHECLNTPPNVGINKLLKSPHFYGISPLAQNVGRCSNLQHSTPDLLTLSLGATMGGHELSWSSSMATPILSKSVDNSKKDISHAEDNYSRINKPSISKKLFNSQLLPTNSKHENSDYENRLDSVKAPKVEDEVSFVEYCARLESTPLRITSPVDGASPTIGMETKNINRMPVSSPLLMDMNLAAQHCLLRDQERLLKESIADTEAEIKNLGAPTPISCCDSEDTPKRPKRCYKPHARNVIRDLNTATADCDKEGDSLPAIPSECCPDLSCEKSICIMPSSLKGHNVIHEENSKAKTSASVSPKYHEVISSGCNLEDDLSIPNASCSLIMNVLGSPAYNTNVLDIIHGCAKVKCINFEMATSLENDLHLTSGYEELIEKDNSKLNADQAETCKPAQYTSTNDLQKEYVQLENMIVTEPVVMEDADAHLASLMSLKELLPSDIELLLGPRAVKVDSASAGFMGFRSIIIEKQLKKDGDYVVNSKSSQDVERIDIESTRSHQRNCAKLNENDQQNECICAKIPNDKISFPKLAILKSDESKAFSEARMQNGTTCTTNNEIPKKFSDTCVTTSISEVLDDQDDDLFLNICSYDCRTKLRSAEKDALDPQVPESPTKLLVHQMESNASAHPGLNFEILTLVNGQVQAQMEFNGFALASGKSIMLSEAALEKARNLFKEDDRSVLTPLELNKRETTPVICLSAFDDRSVGLIVKSANLESQAQTSCVITSEKPRLTPEADFTKAIGTCKEDKLSWIFSSPLQSVLSRHEEKRSADCTTKQNAKSDMSIEQQGDFKKSYNIDRSSTITSKMTSARMFNENDPLMIGSERNVLEKPAPMEGLPQITCKEFSTASGKPVAVSENALKNAKNVFKEDNLPHLCSFEFIDVRSSKEEKKCVPEGVKNHISKNQVTSELVKSLPQLACKGFSTASGKPVLMSKAALDKAKSIFLDDVTAQLVNFDEYPEMTCCSLGGLSSHPSNSDDCLPLNDSENDVLLAEFSELTKAKNSNSTNCQGFSTASGKAVLLSKAALEKAQSIFKEDGLSRLFASELTNIPISSVDEGKGCGTMILESVNPLQECQNADEALHSKKYCPPSDNRANSRKHSWKNAKRTTDFQFPRAIGTAMGGALAVFPTFSLASGRQVHISKTALEKAERMLSEERLLVEQNVTKMGSSSTCFTRGKNDSNIDDSFEDVVVTMKENDDKSKHVDDAAISFHGFLTASGKGAPVSDDALQQARTTLRCGTCRITSSPKCDNNQQFATVPEPNTGSDEFGIHSVSELTHAKDVHSVPCKSVSVGDSCKKHAFSAVDDCEQNVCKRMKYNALSESGTGQVSDEFSMASVKTIAMSKVSLQDARNMFVDNERPVSGLQVVPFSSHDGSGDGSFVPCSMNDWSTLSEEFSHALEDEEGTILTEKNSLLEVPAKVIVEASHGGRLFAIQNEELSTEIMESTDALLADEMIFTPGKGEKRSSSWLSPIQGRPKKLFAHDDAFQSCIMSPKNSILKNNSNASKDLSVIGITNVEVKKCCWRSVPTKAVPLDIWQMRMLAIEEQLMSIAKRKCAKVSPVPGILWQNKLLKKSRASLRSVVNGKRPRRGCPIEAMMHGVKMSTLKIRSFNAGDYQFLLEEHFNDACLNCPGITLDNGFCLIFNEENMAGKKEFYRTLLDTPGVDSQLIDENWVFNHYRWIVWKLAAMEISFPMIFGGRLLTPNEVMLQLHYRYNCEIDFSQRSALKKIMERDDTPAKTLVLCVVGIDERIQKYDDSTYLDASSASDHHAAKYIEVTDGWYCIKAIIDNPLTRLVNSGRICIGQKLIIHGAELIGSAEACTPLEAPPNLALKISANCCRRAKWDAKLGHFVCPKPFPLPLMSFFPDGGLVGCIQIIIARIYPIQYFEKRDDGTSAVYNDRTNSKAALQFEHRKSILMEKIFLDVQDKFDHEETKREQASRHSFGKTNSLHDEIKELVNGDEIYKALENSADPSLIEQCLSHTQQTALTNYKEIRLENQRTKFEAEIRKAIENESETCSVARNVIPFLKFRAVGTLPKDLQKSTGCLITLWRPSPDVYNLLKEGKAVCAYYLSAESRSFSSMRQQELHLKSTKMTKFEEKHESDDILLRTFTPRKLTSMDSIGILGFSPQFGEVDVIGLIVHIGYQEQNKFDFVYLADRNLKIAVIKFWGGLKAFGLDNFLKSGVFIIASNMQWRGKIVSSDWNYLYATEFSMFSQHPKDEYYKNAFNQFKNSFENATSFVETAKEKVIQTMTKQHINASTPRQLYFGKPSSTSTPLIHPLGTNECLDMPPTSVELVQQRLRQLSKYGTPPPLPNLISNNSPLLKSRYQTPTFVTNTRQVESQHKQLHEEKSAESV